MGSRDQALSWDGAVQTCLFFITHLHICESNSTPAKMVEEHHPALTFIAGSPAADMGGPPVAFQEFLARVLFVILNNETQIAPSC